MASNLRIIAEIFDPATDTVTERTMITEKVIECPKNLLGLGFNHKEQIALLQKCQDSLLSKQGDCLKGPIDTCPKCDIKLGKGGSQESDFHSVFTDHRVKIQRLKCPKCKEYSIPSVQSIFGSAAHPDLVVMQCELAAHHSYPETTDILTKQSCGYRKINNQDRIRQNVSSVGSAVIEAEDLLATDPCLPAKQPAAELILNVDGGHVIDKDPNKRSFESLTAVIYQPQNVVINPTTEKGEIIDKSCAASALNDGQVFMKKATLKAALEQGMDDKTHITALCDGATNCWSIVNSLEPYTASITCILDWFHISMKFKNLSSASEEAIDHIEKAKWNVWHGNAEKSIVRLNELLEINEKETEILKINKLITYIKNNKDYIINYEERKNAGLIFTSHMAESTVESLINQRCKAKQHMSWTREGLHSLLQIKAAILSTGNWAKNATSYIFKGLNIAPDILKIC